MEVLEVEQESGQWIPAADLHVEQAIRLTHPVFTMDVALLGPGCRSWAWPDHRREVSPGWREWERNDEGATVYDLGTSLTDYEAVLRSRVAAQLWHLAADDLAGYVGDDAAGWLTAPDDTYRVGREGYRATAASSAMIVTIRKALGLSKRELGRLMADRLGASDISVYARIRRFENGEIVSLHAGYIDAARDAFLDRLLTRLRTAPISRRRLRFP